MSGKAVGRAAVDLPWLCPNTDSLIRLAENPASLSVLAPADPALFAFLARFALGEAGSPFTVPNDLLHSSALPDLAVAYLNAAPSGWLNPASLEVQSVAAVANRAAALARSLALETQRANPDAAETAARLAPLGWFAALAVNETEAAACFGRPELTESRWELDHDSIARRLAARWKLPYWLTAILGNLNLPFDAAAHLGADMDLFAVVSLAVRAAEVETTNLGLTHRSERERLLSHLAILDLDDFPAADAAGSPVSELDQNPHRVPLVVNLLRTAGQARRRSGVSLVMRLEERIDELHRSAESLAEAAGRRLHDAKLASLAEFAAGAGHEINNPLAVISGNAQRLLRTEQDDDRADALRSIVRQSQRISGILRDLMLFARPPKADAEDVLVLSLAFAVYQELLPVAEERGVRLELANAAVDAYLHADPRQVRTALTAVVRNGIEAAGLGGWVRLGCTRAVGSIDFTVEDSGEGLSRHEAEHAFDPFYSGRAAGRGRGLGLSTAWQLAGRNGGELRYDPSDSPTRFVLSFPIAAPQAALRSA